MSDNDDDRLTPNDAEEDFSQRAKQIYHQAIEQPPAKYRDFVTTTCAGDTQLETEVWSLLERDPGRRSLNLQRLTPRDAQDIEVEEKRARSLIGSSAGGWTLGDLLGIGGMGAVFKAKKTTKTGAKITAAVKLLRTEQKSARLDRETEILSQLDHPNIAKVYDAGVRDDGRPYLAMELVEHATRIDVYCDQQRLALETRLRLFQSVCAAVSAAHQSLVVHRDIKPGNILCDERGHVRLVDFGIAQLLEADPVSGNLKERLHTIPSGTPPYWSPEQANMEPVTTLSDIYALGAVLYRLLTGKLPHDVFNRSLVEIAIALKEEPVERPSSCVLEHESDEPAIGVFVRNMQETPKSLGRKLSRDLDEIVLKALAVDPMHRYATAQQLSEDIERYLSGLPVRACEATVLYRSKRWVGRNRMVVALLSILFAASGAFITSAVAQHRQVRRERDRFEDQLVRAEQVSSLLVDLFQVADPGVSRGEITAREVLDRGTERIVEELEDQPELLASLLITMGKVYENLGLYQQALDLAEQSLEIRQRVLDPAALEIADSLNAVGVAHYYAGDYPGTRAALEAGIEIVRLHPDQRLAMADNLNNLGNLLSSLGELNASIEMAEEALMIRREELGEAPLVALAINNLAHKLQENGEFERAEKLHRESLAMRRKLLGPKHPDIAMSLNNLGFLLKYQKRYLEAEPLYREAFEMYRFLYGEEHPDVAWSLNNSAMLLRAMGRPEEAEPMMRECLAIDRKLLGEEHPDVGNDFKNLARLAADRQDYAECEHLAQQAAGIFRQVYPKGHLAILNCDRVIAVCIMQQGRYEEADQLLVSAYENMKQVEGDVSSEMLDVLGELELNSNMWGQSGNEMKYRSLREALTTD